jgi:drug/metabolite transporter (DMT)-like permease
MPVDTPFRDSLRELAPIKRAALLMVLAGTGSTVMNAIIRYGAGELHPFQITFFRAFFALLFMLPWIWRHGGLAALRTPKLGYYTLRSGVAAISMLTWFYGIAFVPLATATALNFTAPLWATVGAALVLGETVRRRRWSAVAVGFLGALVILRPGVAALDFNSLLILVSAATAAMGSITVKYLSRTEPPAAIVTFMVVYLTPLALVPALFVWRWPSAEMLLWMVALGGLGTAVHLCIARALALADASAVAPFEFVRLPFSAFLGWLLFAETTDAWTWLGAAVICGASLYVAHREARLQRLDPASVRRRRPGSAPPH